MSALPIDPAAIIAGTIALGAIAYAIDERITRRRTQRVVVRQAQELTHDRLTGALNREGLAEQFKTVAARKPTVVMFDLDGFKPVNDQHGHHVGDFVLATVASRAAATPGVGLLARLGGDEFAAVVTGPDPREVTGLLMAAIAQPITYGQLTVTVGASAGVALAVSLLTDGLGRADMALLRAKHASSIGAVAVHTTKADGEFVPGLNPRPRVRGRDLERAAV